MLNGAQFVLRNKILNDSTQWSSVRYQSSWSDDTNGKQQTLTEVTSLARSQMANIDQKRRWYSIGRNARLKNKPLQTSHWR